MDIFLPTEILDKLFDNWDEAPEDQFAEAIAETVEHCWFYFQWIMAVREHDCRLVVVQYAEDGADGTAGSEKYPHHQIGELFTLSGMHPEKAMVDAQTMCRDGEDGVTFSMPFSAEIEAQIGHLAAAFDILADEPDQLLVGMLLLEMAHEDYLADMNEGMFYIATRGLENDVDTLLLSEHGDWTAHMMAVLDSSDTVSDTEIYATKDDAPSEKKVPLFCQFQAEDEGDTPEGSVRHMAVVNDVIN